ncbi:DUF938 domain-containing protein [Rhizobium sp. P32RR-XVIII]|nr:DUF938 domain-containing protein [Rhizobium sp. P32RR-XVIII]
MFSPSAARNLEPILAVLKRVLPTHGVVLEIGCGTGEHAVCFAEAMPNLTTGPTVKKSARRCCGKASLENGAPGIETIGAIDRDALGICT